MPGSRSSPPELVSWWGREPGTDAGCLAIGRILGYFLPIRPTGGELSTGSGSGSASTGACSTTVPAHPRSRRHARLPAFAGRHLAVHDGAADARDHGHEHRQPQHVEQLEQLGLTGTGEVRCGIGSSPAVRAMRAADTDVRLRPRPALDRSPSEGDPGLCPRGSWRCFSPRHSGWRQPDQPVIRSRFAGTPLPRVPTRPAFASRSSAISAGRFPRSAIVGYRSSLPPTRPNRTGR